MKQSDGSSKVKPCQSFQTVSTRKGAERLLDQTVGDEVDEVDLTHFEFVSAAAASELLVLANEYGVTLVVEYESDVAEMFQVISQRRDKDDDYDPLRSTYRVE